MQINTPKRALLSVSDKEGLVPLAQFLSEKGIDLLSTGGTARTLRDAGLTVTDVADITGFPEMMEGRVKTLHPKIHGGLLGRQTMQSHMDAMKEHGIEPIDLLIVNLYPFVETISKNASYEEAVEQIDIGGPGMIRAAAKNHESVTVMVDPADYDALISEMTDNDGGIGFDFRQKMAARAFQRTAVYDAAIAQYMAEAVKEPYGAAHTLGAPLKMRLRYGENPHQQAAWYSYGNRIGIGSAQQLQGKELSYNNIADADAAFEIVAAFDEPVVAIIKHANPCGVAKGKTIEEAYIKALRCDPVSAFGGIVAMNRTLDVKTAERIANVFTEVVIAPDADKSAREVLAKKKNLRLLLTGGLPDTTKADQPVVKTLSDGFLVQDQDVRVATEKDLTVVTEKKPDEALLDDLLFAFAVVKHVKSNAVIFVKDGATVGIGAGQMSRVDATKIAVRKSKEAAKLDDLAEDALLKGSVVGSDAFFPFADGVNSAAEAGAIAIVQPGGSMRDDEVIKAADEQGLSMVFTGFRHFRH